MATNNRDVIYIDIDDEITSIIDKLRSSESRIVALVLPKRATMLQSSVNMKLLKKAADDDNKRLVLITAESGLQPLAGMVGLYVAKTLQSKPEIPTSSTLETPSNEIETVEETIPAINPELSPTAAVGELAGLDMPTPKPVRKPELAPRPIPTPREDEDDAIELDNAVEAVAADTAADDELNAPKKRGKGKKDKSLKVPNFNRFRRRLLAGMLLLIVLIAGWLVLSNVLSHATVTIATKTSSVNANLTLNLSTSASSVDPTTSTIPAYLQKTQKTLSQQVPTTGQQNQGNTASGSVTLTDQECGPNITGYPSDLPAGTAVTTNGLTFTTQQDTSFNQFNNAHNGCINFQASGPTPITAQNPGSNYNVSNATFTVSGSQNITGNGTTTGGTDNIVQTVAQSDITNATQKLGSANTGAIKSSLESALEQAGYYPLPATFASGTPSTSSSAQVGQQATTVTVTQTTTYTMYGVHKSDVQTLLDQNIQSQLTSGSQHIQNDGLSSATYSLASQSGSGSQITVQTTAVIGPDIKPSTVKSLVAGKKSGDIQSIFGAYPGVVNVTVKYSPFWVSTVPKNQSKITVKFVSANGG